MAKCEHMDDCKISTSECNRLSVRLMRAKKRCFEPPEPATSSRSDETLGYKASGKNRYGVDVDYFRKEFSKLSRDLDNYTKDELARYLRTLSDTAAL